jgi:hypothetical protein
MKKYILIFLLLVSLTSFSQVDTTAKQAAKEEWIANTENRDKPMPIWDNDGNIIGFTAILLSALLFTQYLYKTHILRKLNQDKAICQTNL